MTNQQYQKCIDACIECATTCNHCAVSCLEEKDVQYLTKCIRLNLECAVICRASAELMTLRSTYSRQICDLCAAICNACAKMCEQHANMGIEHCRECAEACRTCAKEMMEVYHGLNKEEQDNYKTTVHQNECAVISRTAAEIMSLESDYCNKICELSATICDAYAGEFDRIVSKEVKYARECATIATEAYQHMKAQEKDSTKQPVKQNEVIKKKHSSALLAASMYRSPVSAVSSNAYFSGGVDNTGINTEFREQGGIG